MRGKPAMSFRRVLLSIMFLSSSARAEDDAYLLVALLEHADKSRGIHHASATKAM
jgi:hypothetical protein